MNHVPQLLPSALLRCGDLTLDPDTGELVRDGEPLPLAAQPASVLALLMRRAAEGSGRRLVTREEIRRHVWGDEVCVDYEQGINAAVRQVRSALDDRADSPHFVETVPRRGYRFIAPVEVETAGEPAAARGAPPTPPANGPQGTGEQADDAPASAPSGPSRGPHSAALPGPARLGRLVAAVVLPLLLAAGVLATWIGGQGESPRPAAAPRLVVLPFTNLSGDPSDAWLGRGLSEDLSAALSRRYAARLSVIARTSARRLGAAGEPPVREGRPSVREAVARLGVDYAVEGSVRRQGDDLRVAARLLRADGRQLWAGTYDRSVADALAVQRELGDKIARALALHLLPREAGVTADGAADAGPMAAAPAAYEAYLRGRDLLSRRHQVGTAEALRWLQRAATLDPSFAPAWVELARALRFRYPPRRGIVRVRGALERALALDDTYAPAHLMAATVHFYYDRDRRAAGRHFRRALELHPGYAEAHHAYAGWLAAGGRHREALRQVEQARALDPLSPAVNADVGWYRYFARDWDGAVAASRRTLELDPGFFWARRSLLLALVAAGEGEAAVAVAREELVDGDAAVEVPDARRAALAALDAARAVGEWNTALDAYWGWRLAARRAEAERGYLSPVFLADLHMARGDGTAALAELERAADEHSGWTLPFLEVHPLYDPLRGDPRFRELLDRLGSG